MKTVKLALAAATAGAAIMAAAPASAMVITFATFSDPTTVDNFRLVNSGNGTNRTTNATLFSTKANGSMGSPIVRFSFTQDYIKDYVSNVNALFTYSATVPKGTNAFVDPFTGDIVQPGITGSFSFLTTAPITVTGPHFYTHTYAAGSNLLSGTFTTSHLAGGGSSASTDSSTATGSVVTFSSDFLNFSNTVNRDRGLTLTAISPNLGIHSGVNKALNGFRAVAGGQFSSDPAPLINGIVPVPEPGVWLMMIAGFGLVGVSTRRRSSAAVA